MPSSAPAGWRRQRRRSASAAPPACASDRPKRGDHCFHVSVHTGVRTTTHSLTLVKEARDRDGEERVLDRVLLNALAEAFNVASRLGASLLPGEEVIAELTIENEPLSRFLAGETLALHVEMDGLMRPDAPKPALLLPGAFNPLHAGHIELAKVASAVVGAPAAFDLSVLNADKPPLADEEVRRRLAQFAWQAPVWLTRAPTYTEKAELFPGCVFVVGADTAARIVQPRFYYDSAGRMAEALGRIRALGCRFLVAGRAGADGRFVGLDGLNVPPEHRDLFRAIPEAAFRVDLSSTLPAPRRDTCGAMFIGLQESNARVDTVCHGCVSRVGRPKHG